MLNYQIRGLSMIELMVVIAIISAAAVFAIQSYQSYMVKSRFSQVLATISQYKDDAQAAFIDKDQFPSTFDSLTASAFTTITSPVITGIYYGLSSNKQASYLQFYTLNLGIPGYVVATGGSGGTSCRVTAAMVPSAEGNMQFFCGQWDGSGEDVPLSYLPQSCQDTNISALIT